MRPLTTLVYVLFVCTGCESADVSDGHGTVVPLADEFYPPSSEKADVVCEPGGSIGVCQTCDEAGRVRTPLSDERCPRLSCRSLSGLTTVTVSNETYCVHRQYGEAPGSCGRDGRCLSVPTHETCSVEQESVLLGVVEPCSYIEGCVAGGSPELRRAEDGTPCGGGVCLAGQCVAQRRVDKVEVTPSASCSVFPADPFCDEGVDDSGVDFCEFRAKTPHLISCAELCAEVGSWCLAAWDDSRDSCDHQEHRSCEDRDVDLICRCVQPSLTQGDPFSGRGE